MPNYSKNRGRGVKRLVMCDGCNNYYYVSHRERRKNAGRYVCIRCSEMPLDATQYEFEVIGLLA